MSLSNILNLFLIRCYEIWDCEREKKLVGILPPTMFCAYAHTSSIWLMFGLMTQWYTSLSGSLHCLAWTSHFFLTAASLQLFSLSGQPFTTCTVDLVTSHELLPATTVCKIYQKYIWSDVIFIQKRHFFNTAPLLINLFFKCQIKIWKHTRNKFWII